jgi:hypothetical protein
MARGGTLEAASARGVSASLGQLDAGPPERDVARRQHLARDDHAGRCLSGRAVPLERARARNEPASTTIASADAGSGSATTRKRPDAAGRTSERREREERQRAADSARIAPTLREARRPRNRGPPDAEDKPA